MESFMPSSPILHACANTVRTVRAVDVLVEPQARRRLRQERGWQAWPCGPQAARAAGRRRSSSIRSNA